MIDNRLKIRQQKPTKEELAVWADITKNIAKGDFALVRSGITGGQQIIELSASSLHADTVSEIIFNDGFKPSFMTEYGFSLNQRTKGIYSTLGVESLEQYNETFQEYTIASISQTTTTLTVTLNEEFKKNIGYWCNVYGLADNRFNYANLNVNTISADKKTLTFAYSDDISLPSLTATPASVVGGKLKCHSLFSNNFARYNYRGVINTRGTLSSRFNGGSYRINGTLSGSQYSTIGITDSIFSNNGYGNCEIKATNRPKITLNEDTLRFMDSSCDSNGTIDITRGAFTEVKPSFFQTYRNVMRLITPKSVSLPIAKIKSISKSGTTTATVTTDIPHNLTAGVSYVTIKGVRDQTNFANITTPAVVVSTPTSTTFTIVLGSATTATSYGGAVILANGQVDIQGFIGQTAQTISRDSVGLVTIVGSASWSGLNVGEYVDVYGCLDASGNDLLLDGAYRVFNTSTTTLILEPIKNLDGTYTLDGENNQMTPSNETMVINTTNCGGAVISRTTIRMHDISAVSYAKQMVQLEGQGISDASLAMPVMFPATPSVDITNTFGTNGLSGVMVNPSNGSLNDIVTGAITSTTTSSSLVNTMGNGFQVTIPVTAVSGTNPTLDVSIEESFDGGTNWVTLYYFQRITATGSYNSPVLRATGSHIRYKRTITGTSPSFTMSVSRNVRPMIPAEVQKRLIDRSISLTTQDSVTPVLFQGAANNVQLVINLGATTTPPAIQLEGSEDGVNFYPIGSPLTGVVSKTVQLTVNGVSATYTRAKVATVGASVTMGYVAIKAWS